MANTLNLGSGNWGVKDSSLLGYKKRQNGRFLPETFDVARGSAGTRVNQSGLIESPEEILSADLVTNGDFTTDTDWTKQDGWTISGGKANANMVLGGNGNIYQTILTIGKTYKLTFTVSNYVQGYARNLSQDGTMPLYNSNGTFTEYFVANTSNLFMNASTSESTQLSIDNVSVVEVNRDNLARIDYLDDAAGVLLTEPQSTNLVTNSNDFSNASLDNAIITSNLLTSPSGLTNTNKVIASVANSTHSIFLIPSVSSSTKYTFSLYAKSDEYERLYIRQGTGTLPSAAVYELNGNGSVLETYGSPQDTSITNVGNGWYRITLTNTTSASGANFAPNIMGIPNSGYTATASSVTFLGDGTSGVYIWGAQLEEGSYATSYIPTVGVAATRLADVVNNAGDVNNFNSEEGVLFAEISALANNSTKKGISISDGTTANRIILRYDDASNRIKCIVISSGVIQANMNTAAYDILDNLKIAVKFKENDFALWVNGLEVVTDTSGNTFPTGTLSELNLDSTTLEPFYGKTKNIQVFDEALSDAELQTLTTI